MLQSQWHHEKNGSLRCTDVTAGSHQKVWWICDQGHTWQAVVKNRSNGNGCPYCSGRKAWPGENDLATVDPQLARQWHPTENGALTPEQVTARSSKKVWWRCAHGHEWQATIVSRTKGAGCPYCAGRCATAKTCLATVFPALAAQWDGQKNAPLTPRDVTAFSNRRCV